MQLARGNHQLARLGLCVHDGAEHAPGQMTIDDFQRVAVRLIKAQPVLQMLGKRRKTAGDQHGIKTCGAHPGDQFFCAGRKTHPLAHDGGHCRDGQTPQQCDPRGERLGKIQLALHGAFGNRRNFRLHAVVVGQFIDALDGNQRRIHVADEGAEVLHTQFRVVAPEHIQMRLLGILRDGGNGLGRFVRTRQVKAGGADGAHTAGVRERGDVGEGVGRGSLAALHDQGGSGHDCSARARLGSTSRNSSAAARMAASVVFQSMQASVTEQP